MPTAQTRDASFSLRSVVVKAHLQPWISKNLQRGQHERREVPGTLLQPQVATSQPCWVCLWKGKLDKAKPYKEYLRSYYIKDDSPFSPSSWAGLKFKTTNNGAKSFHRHFGDLFNYLYTKPGIWEFLRTMAIYNVV